MKNTANTHQLVSLDKLDFTSRIITPELIDDFHMSGASVKKVFNELQWLNRRLGTVKRVVKPLIEFISRQNKDLRVVDIGCGSGDILRAISEYKNHYPYRVELTGLDANPTVIDIAQAGNTNPDIRYECVTIENDPGVIPPADIYIMSQFLHHFEMEKIQWMIKELMVHQPSFIIINDLRRSELAFHLFGLLCKWKGLSFTTTYDGQLSISKGFVKNEMETLIRIVPLNYVCQLKRKQAFYWQLTLEKLAGEQISNI